MKPIKKIIKDGDELPKYYAVAYLAPNMYGYVCYPIGIHWIMNLWRRVYRVIRTGAIEKAEFLGWNKGYLEGRKQGYDEGLAFVVYKLEERIAALSKKKPKANTDKSKEVKK